MHYKFLIFVAMAPQFSRNCGKITNGPKSVGKVCAHHFVVRRPIDKEFKKIHCNTLEPGT